VTPSKEMAVACIIAGQIKAVSIDPTHRFCHARQGCSFYRFPFRPSAAEWLGQPPSRGGALLPCKSLSAR
jgi:hypothetical protein